MLMKLKQKYRIDRGVVRNGVCKPRTTMRIKIGYHKHRYEGCSQVPRYQRARGWNRTSGLQ